MPSAGKPVWTTARKLQGNLGPLVVGLAVGALVWFISARKSAPKPEMPVASLTPAIAAFVVSAWASLNWLGLAGNASMRRELGRRLSAERKGAVDKPWFVGFARPTSVSLLDAHEDIGFIIFHPDELEFWGDTLRLSVSRTAIQKVRFMPSVHTALGLGRWVCLDGELDGKPIRMMLEPREKSSMLGNLREGSRLKTDVEAWLKASPSPVVGDD